MTDSHKPPFSEILQAIPGFFGIRLEEEPAYEVVEHIGEVEVRRYAPMVLAQVTVQGTHDEAMDAAFDKLAGYLYGGNQSGRQMDMTSPVFQRSDAATSTLTAQVSAAGGWTVSFFLSSAMTQHEAPEPEDPAIELVQQTAMHAGVLRYTGNNSDERRADATRTLMESLAGQSRWKVDHDVYWAQYDQPFAIPFLKRNEAHVALVETGSGSGSGAP